VNDNKKYFILMLGSLLKAIIPALFVLVISSCVDPYTPELKGYESLLVVSGLITDEQVPYEVTLSRSFQRADSVAQKVKDAMVLIADETGRITYLRNLGNGTYVTDPEEFTGSTGKTYTLHITTADGKEYISAPARMLPVPDIESIYYEKDNDIGGANNKISEGIRFYVNAPNGSGETQYVRWEYEETWKFRLNDYKRFNYFSDTSILPVGVIKEFCWKTRNSSDILIGSMTPGENSATNDVPVCFVASAESDRLTIEYSLLVKQYSLSGEAYEYLNNLKLVNEAGGTIFDKQPFPVISNITNVNDPGEKVLGYFQVSSVRKERIFVTAGVVNELGLPFYHYDCTRYEAAPIDFHVPGSMTPLMTWDELYEMFTGEGNFAFIEPVYDPDTHALIKLAFTESECSDCELTGSVIKPDWWIDLD
jgi:hypothetical protein